MSTYLKLENWNAFMATLVLYSVFSSVFELGFIRIPSLAFTITNSIVYTFFLGDLFVSFNYQSLSNILAALPFIPYYYLTPPPIRFYNIINVLIFFRVRDIETIFKRFQTNPRLSYKFIHSIRLILIFIFYVHTCASALYLLAYTYPDFNKTWIFVVMGPEFLKSSVFSRYITCIYYATTSITTIGFGDIHPLNLREMEFHVIFMFTSLVVVGFLIQRGYNLYCYDEEKNRKSIFLNRFVLQNDLSQPLMKEVFEQFDLELNQDIDWIEYNKALISLPGHLRSKISIHHFNRLGQNVYLFQGVSDSTIKQIAPKVEAGYFSSGEYMIRYNEASNYFFLVLEGTMELIDVAVTTERCALIESNGLTAGGELGVLFHQNQPYSIRAKTNCLVLKVLADDFWDSFSEEEHVIVLNNLFQRLLMHESGFLRTKVLHLAAASGKLECVEYVRQNGGIHINSRDLTGSVPIWEALLHGHYQLAEHMRVEMAANLNIGDVSAFFLKAVEMESLELVKELIKKGAGQCDTRAINLACQINNVDMLSVLSQHRSDDT